MDWQHLVLILCAFSKVAKICEDYVQQCTSLTMIARLGRRFHIHVPSPVFSYQTYTALNSIVFGDVEPIPEHVETEYFFGECPTDKKLVLFERYNYYDIKGRMVIRGYSNLMWNVDCIYIRVRSVVQDFVRYHPEHFNICVVRIRYYYSSRPYTYYYYEWYLPVTIINGMEFELSFYVSE